MNMEKVILANIIWNSKDWRALDINSKAGHTYVRTFPGHESLNFKFDKNGIDDDIYVYGYIQWTQPPVRLSDDAIIIFYTKATVTDTFPDQIVGIYGRAKKINQKNVQWDGFEDNLYFINVQAQKDFSILFPIPLDAEKYKANGQRLVPRVNFTYKTEKFAKQIILDEIKALQKNGIMGKEYIKLKNIYEYYYGDLNMDEIEQTELVSIYNDKTKAELCCEILKDTKENSEIVFVNRKEYKRNNVIIAKIKLLREFSCQICGKVIIKKNGEKYIEAAHIKAKSKGGQEALNNIVLLCPNHHKEFDIGNSEILFHDDNKLILKIDDNEYTIELGFIEKVQSHITNSM